MSIRFFFYILYTQGEISVVKDEGYKIIYAEQDWHMVI